MPPPTTNISPFSFLCWKDDDASLMVSTPESPNYLSLIAIDGIDADDIVRLAKEKGDSWADTIAEFFPSYVAELAGKKKRTCFVHTGTALVEYADAITCEVLEREMPASADAYEKSVAIEGQRKSGPQHPNPYAAPDSDGYETVDSDEEEADDAEKERHIVAMVGSQIETALYLGHQLGLTNDVMRDIFGSIISSDIPASSTECCKATTNEAVLMYLMSLQHQS